MSDKLKLCILLLWMGFLSSSQAQTIDYKFQSVFLYNFAKNIEWPTAQQTSEVSIGIVGNAKVAKEMQAILANKTINSKKMVVHHFASPTEITYCHILFIPTSNKNNLAQILQKIGTSPTLLVTEQSGWGKLGSVINFVISEDGKFKFELNQQAASKHKLRIPQEITTAAILL